ncbi:MAG: hypothetical protein Q8P81_03725 [Nanoarchaeota archaeon]|nr:hypothetical protein [Nanoarchaeota archaeon]
MHWNYRVIKRVVKYKGRDGNELREDFYAIYEVFYEEDGMPTSWSESPMHIQGESLEELKHDHDLYKRALEKPVLYWNEDEGEGKDKLEETGEILSEKKDPPVPSDGMLVRKTTWVDTFMDITLWVFMFLMFYKIFIMGVK